MSQTKSDEHPSASFSDMPFFVACNIDKVDAATRKLIRSHAMRGRKQKRITHSNSQQDRGNIVAARRVEADQVNFQDILTLYSPATPSSIGSDLCFVTFAEDLDLSMLLSITKISPISMRIIFPLMTLVGFGDNAEWLHTIRDDRAALHMTSFAVESFIDAFLHQRDEVVSPTAMMHFQKGVSLLRERLQSENVDITSTDSTIGTVLKLTTAAVFSGEHLIAKQHMQGVQKLVDLRGGLSCFSGKFLQLEMLRWDLIVAMLNDSTPVFYCRPSEPFIDYPLQTLPTFGTSQLSAYTTELLNGVDPELKVAWCTMRRFCLLVNLGSQTQRRIPLSIIIDTMASVMYRLIYMKFKLGSVDETVRLGLLVFSYHLFLQWQDIKFHHQGLCDAYKQCVQDLKCTHKVSSGLMLWLLVVGALAIFELEQEDWLKERSNEHAALLKVTSWKKMQEVLKSFLWVPLLDDRQGEDIFNTLDLARIRATPI